MVDYSCIDIVITNPADIILSLQSQFPIITESDSINIDSINSSFNEQLQIVNQNKYIIKKEKSTTVQTRQALLCMIDALKHIKNIYSSNYAVLQEKCTVYENNKFLDQYKKEIDSLSSDIYKLDKIYRKIDINQIREVSTLVSEEDMVSIFDKINTFLSQVNTLANNPNNSTLMSREMYESDIMFTQLKEILFYTDDDLVDKLPENMKTFIFNYISLTGYYFKYDFTQTLANQDLFDDTKSMLAYFDNHYWINENNFKMSIAESDTTTSDNTIMSDNEASSYVTSNKTSIENRPSVNVDEQVDVNQNTDLALKKESLLTRIINKIKSLFFRK